ncbi:MAG: hypothetical protein FD123_775 [Bacteroidetes bacterium]|nr:MAG: hypothetical protein FD123_775 [Bacteroidota bacterium]
MKGRKPYGQNESAPVNMASHPSRIALYIQRIEELNRLIKNKKDAVILKEKQVKKERRQIDQLEEEYKQANALLIQELSVQPADQVITLGRPELCFDWNPEYDLETFFKLVTGAIPRTDIVIYPIAFEDFKAAFTPGAAAKSRIDCINLKVFTEILYVLMRKGVVLINEKLLEQAIMDRCLHKSGPASKTNLQQYTYLSRSDFARNTAPSETVEIILSHLKVPD